MGFKEFRRRYERRNYGTDVVFSFKGRAFEGRLKDISVGGAFVNTLAVDQVYQGDIVALTIPFTDGQKNVKRRARVLWTSAQGFAVEFL